MRRSKGWSKRVRWLEVPKDDDIHEDDIVYADPLWELKSVAEQIEEAKKRRRHGRQKAHLK